MAAIRLLVTALVIIIFVIAIKYKKLWLLGVAGVLAISVFIGGYVYDHTYTMDRINIYEIRTISGRMIEYVDDQEKVNKLYYNQYIPIEIDKSAVNSMVHIHERMSKSGNFSKEIVKLVLTENDSSKINELKGIKGENKK